MSHDAGHDSRTSPMSPAHGGSQANRVAPGRNTRTSGLASSSASPSAGAAGSGGAVVQRSVAPGQQAEASGGGDWTVAVFRPDLFSQPVQRRETAGGADAPAQRRVQVTASALNVRSSPSVARDNRVGRLENGAVVTVVGDADGWLQIDYENGRAYISARYTRPMADEPQTSTEGSGGTGDAGTATGGGQATGGDQEPAGSTGQDSGTTTTGGGAVGNDGATTTGSGDQEQPADATDANDRFGTIVRNLVHDYQNVPVWNPGQSVEEAPAGTFVTPYVLNTPESVQTALRNERNTHQNLATRGGSTVRAETGNRPFTGKGTPAECQIIAQAAIDAQLTTVAGIQQYVNNGPMNSSGSRQNGRWGVDCSGFTAIAASEMAGNGRDVSGNRRSTEYRPGGSAITSGGYTQISGDNAQAGDVISYMTTNHVVVVYERQDVNISNAEGETQPAVMLRVGESSGSGIRATNTFWHVPNALRYGDTTPRTAPDVHLLRKNGEDRPTWQAYRDGFKVLTTGGFNVNRYSIVRPPANQAVTDEGNAEGETA